MNLLFLSDNFPPEVNAPANRTFEHCREWTQLGAKVTVITCAPNFPQGKLYPGYKNKLYQKELMDGIEVCRVWSYMAANKGFLKRILDYGSFAGFAFLAGLFRKADVVIATSPQFLAALAGWALAFVKRKPWIMEVRDLWPESIRAVGALKHKWVYRRLEKIEMFLYKQATAIVVVTESFKAKLVSRGIPGRKIHVVKNGVIPRENHGISENPQLREKLLLDQKFVIGYIGTHGLAHNLDFILKAAKKAPAPIHFLFIGDGSEKEKLQELHRELELENVTLLPPVPKAEVPAYIDILDVALVPLRKSDTFKSVIPSKIFENAAQQKPILLGVEGEAKDLIESYGAGLCFEPENEADFLQKLGQLSSDMDLYKKCQAGCKRLACDFDRRRLAEMMFDIITAVS